MDRLLAMQTFVRVVETGSFSAVAREQSATQSAVSKQVAALERHLGDEQSLIAAAKQGRQQLEEQMAQERAERGKQRTGD